VTAVLSTPKGWVNRPIGVPSLFHLSKSKGGETLKKQFNENKK